jgi:aldehyde:ferredoxin oxidoreductase
MANGYAGKILLVNFTSKTTSIIDTAKYEEFAGGVGIGAAIFWDLAVVPGDWDLQDAFDPRNVVSLMSGPLGTTGAPGCGRTSICGIAPEPFTSPEIEYRYYQVVTGSIKSFADTIEVGRKIWNMERAIRVMAGRHRDKEQFAPFMFMPGATFNISGTKPVYQDGKWSFEDQSNMYLDREGVELFKTNFYKLEGWDVKTGWPTRKALEGLGMKRSPTSWPPKADWAPDLAATFNILLPWIPSISFQPVGSMAILRRGLIKSVASAILLTALRPLIQYPAVAFRCRNKHA